MTYSEYEQKFREIAANPDPALLVSVLGEIKKDCDKFDGATASAEISKKQIEELQATVQKQKADMYDVLMGAGFRRPADQIPKQEDKQEEWENLRGQAALDAFVASKEQKDVKEDNSNG